MYVVIFRIESEYFGGVVSEDHSSHSIQLGSLRAAPAFICVKFYVANRPLPLTVARLDCEQPKKLRHWSL